MCIRDSKQALDPGVGDSQRLKALQTTLRPKLRFDGLDFLALRHLAQDIEAAYLNGWAAASSRRSTSRDLSLIHIDVYKRQLEHHQNVVIARRLRCQRVTFEHEIRKGSLSLLMKKTIGPPAVSYTHLGSWRGK